MLAEDKEGGKFNPLQRTSRRLQRNVQSTFGAETLALVNGVDNGLCVTYLVDEINSNLPADQFQTLPGGHGRLRWCLFPYTF